MVIFVVILIGGFTFYRVYYKKSNLENKQQMNLNLTLTFFIVIIKDYSKDRVVYPTKDSSKDKKFLDKLQDFYKEMTRTTQASGNKENYSIAKDQEEEEEE